jgi:Icc protein
MLDSVVPGQPGGHLRQAQLELLERSLSAHPDRHAMVCLHHHPVSVHSRWMDTIGVDNAADFWAVIDAHPQVRAVVWGHIHQDFHERRGDVELIATPSTCIQFKPGQEEFALDEAPPGYRWFRLHDDGRVETGVERLEQMPTDVDLECGGYK